MVDAEGVEMIGIGGGFVPEGEHLNGFDWFDLFGEGGGLKLDTEFAVDLDGATLIGTETFDAF